MVVVAIIGIGLLIFIHELGHFVAAKILGIKVDEFMLGLPGPKLLKIKKGETTYGITIIPFGGYVKFADSKLKKSKYLFEFQSALKKITVIVAGPLMNFILPMFLVTIVFLVGAPFPSSTVNRTIPGYPAEKAGFKDGDKIIEIGGKKVSSWEEITKTISANPTKEMTFVVLRNNEKIALKATIVKKNSFGFLGVESRLETRSLGLSDSVKMAVVWTFTVFKEMVGYFYEFITKEFSVFIREARSPIGIVSEASQVAKESPLDFLMFLSIISLNLTIVNLFPIPPLDGGMVLIFLVEKIRKKPIETSKLAAIQAIGISLLLILMLYLIFSDIMRIITSASAG